MRLYKYQAEAFKKVINTLQKADYFALDGTKLELGSKLTYGSVLNTRQGRTTIKTIYGDLYEFTPEDHTYQVGSRNLVEQLPDGSFKVYISIELIQALNDYWLEVLKPAFRMQTDAFSIVEATSSSVWVCQFDGKTFEWVSNFEHFGRR